MELLDIRAERDRLKSIVDADSEFIIEQAKESAAPMVPNFENKIH